MSRKTIKDIVASQNSSIKEVMRLIDCSGIRVAYIVDEHKKLIGAVSDSEIRRAILKGKDIKESVKNILNPKPIILKEKDILNSYIVKKTIRKLLNKMPDSRYILILDEKNRPKRIESCSGLLGEHKLQKKDLKAVSKNVLVVGGAGYLGSVLVRKLLAKGFKVRALDLLLFGAKPVEGLLNNDNFELIEGDMRNISILIKALDGVDGVINLAAVVGDPACNDRPETAIETNFLANKVLAEACKYNQINRFIYASTCSVYGAMENEAIELDESSPLNPVSLYARSKIISEEGILSLEDENFAPTILRMATLYGYSPRMRFDLVVNTMTKTAVVDNKICIHGGGKQWRPLLHVADAADVYIKCLEANMSKIKGQIYNVGSNEQNYQIIKIGEIVNQYVPKANMMVVGETHDPRNYFVSFSNIKNNLKFKINNNLKKAIIRIKKAIESREIRNVDDSKYYNVERNN